MNRKNAIVTLVVGDKYKKNFNKYSRKSFAEYAEKINADLIIIEEKLDTSNKSTQRSIAWQKLLILDQTWSEGYEQILWIDSDVVINTKNADDIFSVSPIDKVSGVDAYKIPNEHDYILGLKRLYKYWKSKDITYLENYTAHDYYLNRGITTKNMLSSVLHTGVFVCSPKFHNDIFLEIYLHENPINNSSGNYEMPIMSARLLEEGFVTWIDHKYNYCVNEIIASDYPELIQNNKFFQNALTKRVIRDIFSHGKFIHFAGCTDKMKYLK